MSTDANLVSYERPEYCAASPDLTLMDDVLAGTRRMHEKSSTGNGRAYIRKWPDEKPEMYEFRRICETFFEGTGRTLTAGIGLLFTKPPAMTWNKSETAMAGVWANIDGTGTAGPVFVKRFAEMVIRDGLAGILVDHPTTPPEAQERSDIADALNLQPTWALYRRAQIINWRTAKVNNQTVYTLIVLRESGDVTDGDYGIKSVTRYRVLRLVLTPDGYQATWQVYEQTGDGSKDTDFVLAGAGVFKNTKGQVADRIPFVVAYAGRTDVPMVATIPLLGVANANLAHWQISTDLRFYRSLAAYPQPVVTGELAQEPGPGGQLVPGKVRMGPGNIIHLTGDGASFEWSELAGTAMVQLENGIKEKLNQMGQLGLSFLVSDTRAAETADAKRLDATAENATLGTAAQGLDDGGNSALEITAWYLGIEKDGAPVIAINRDFENTVMDATTIGAYVQLVNAGFPKLLVLEAFQAGGRIKPDADLEQIALEWDGAAASIARDKANAAADAFAMQNGGAGDGEQLQEAA